MSDHEGHGEPYLGAWWRFGPLQRAPAGDAGVESAAADHETGRVLVNVEPTVASEVGMRAAIEELGYRVVG